MMSMSRLLPSRRKRTAVSLATIRVMEQNRAFGLSALRLEYSMVQGPAE